MFPRRLLLVAGVVQLRADRGKRPAGLGLADGLSGFCSASASDGRPSPSEGAGWHAGGRLGVQEGTQKRQQSWIYLCAVAEDTRQPLPSDCPVQRESVRRRLLCGRPLLKRDQHSEAIRLPAGGLLCFRISVDVIEAASPGRSRWPPDQVIGWTIPASGS